MRDLNGDDILFRVDFSHNGSEESVVMIVREGWTFGEVVNKGYRLLKERFPKGYRHIAELYEFRSITAIF